MVEYVEFHNPNDAERITTFVFEFDRLPPELSVTFQLTPLQTVGPLGDALIGVASQAPVQPGDMLLRTRKVSWLGLLIEWLRILICWIVNLVRWFLGRPRRRCRKRYLKLPQFAPTLYEAAASERVEVRDVRLGPHERVAAAVAIAPTGRLEPGERFSFDIQQLIRDGEFEEVIGGGRYVVVVEGEKKYERKPAIATSHDPEADFTPEELARLEREAERYRYVPPHARELVEEREREQGKDRE
jgi:hypothetical protein